MISVVCVGGGMSESVQAVNKALEDSAGVLVVCDQEDSPTYTGITYAVEFYIQSDPFQMEDYCRLFKDERQYQRIPPKQFKPKQQPMMRFHGHRKMMDSRQRWEG